MKYFDAFSGIGGFSLGIHLEHPDWECVGFSEIDKYAIKVFEKHFPGVKNYGDIRFIHSKEYLDNAVNIWYNPITEEDYIMAGKLKKLTVCQVEESIRMYEMGMSLELIGDYFNVSRQSMWDLLKRRMKLRDKKRYGEDNNFFRGTKADGRTHDIVEYALKRGIIERPQNCQSCGGEYKFKDGRNAIQAHHVDYNKPMDIIWLCQKCHHEWHKKNKAEPKGELKEVEGFDLLTFGFP